MIGFGGDFSGTDINSFADDPFSNGKKGRPTALSARTDEIKTLTGRVGYALDEVLFYGKGGAAYAHDRYSSSNAGAITNVIFGCACGNDCNVPAARSAGDGRQVFGLE